VTLRQSHNQKDRNISRKDAKVAKKNKKYLSELGVLRALAGGISESEMFHLSENLRKLRKLLRIAVQRLEYFLIKRSLLCALSASALKIVADQPQADPR